MTPKPHKALHHYAFEAIGTHWEIELYTEPVGGFAALESQVAGRIELFDKTYSRFRDDSLVTAMSRKAGTYTLPADAEPLFDLYRELYDTSKGKVTPLVGAVLSDAGYDATYSLKPGHVRPAQRWDDVLTYRFPQLVVHSPVLLDFGAAGKGYLVDIVGNMLEAVGVHDYVVDAGGDMRLRGMAPRMIGLEHPGAAGRVIGTVSLRDTSLCGSAVNRRAWAGYHHIMDPETGLSVSGVRAVWVIADTTMLADALTTCLFFMSPSLLEKRYTFTYGLIRDDYSFSASEGFAAELFT